eukprot:46231_1
MPTSVKPREVKVVLLGDAGVGKSSLAAMFVTQKFTPHSESTIGANFLCKQMTVGNISFKFQIWDTAGQEKYRSLAPLYYRGAIAAILMYDITSQRSFRAVTHWVNELQTRGPQGIVIALAGNKCDHESNREMKKEEAERFAEDIGALFFETSAKDGDGVMDIFLGICQKLPQKKVQQVKTIGLDKLGSQNSSACC